MRKTEERRGKVKENLLRQRSRETYASSHCKTLWSSRASFCSTELQLPNESRGIHALAPGRDGYEARLNEDDFKTRTDDPTLGASFKKDKMCLSTLPELVKDRVCSVFLVVNTS